MDRETLLEKLLTCLKETGAYQLEHFRKFAHGSGNEKAAGEFVSHIDIESEGLLHDRLVSLLPGSVFFGEETVQQRSHAYTWVVDPIDGTTNYISGFSEWSISAALIESDITVLSAVYRPFSGEHFTALRDRGAWYQYRPIAPPGSSKLKDSLVATAFPYRSPDTADAFFACAREMLYASRGLRRVGSAALDICYTAAGFLQGFWEPDLQPYDVAAALLFSRECGGVTTDFFNNPYELFSSTSLISAIPGVHGEMQEIIGKHYACVPRLAQGGSHP